MSSPCLTPVLEVFASIQGEGAFVGEPQVFVRLGGCPLRCGWCDTPESWAVPGRSATARLDLETGPERVGAWALPREIAAWVGRLDPGGRRPVSLTGGEPLMWPELILSLRAELGGRRLHLETSGAFPRTLERVLEAVDHVSADHKLPADLGPAVPLGPGFGAPPTRSGDWRKARRAMLGLLAGRDACAKLVVVGGRAVHDYTPILTDHAELAPELPLYVQPVTPTRKLAAPGAELLEGVVREAETLGLFLRVVPQVHPLLGLH